MTLRLGRLAAMAAAFMSAATLASAASPVDSLFSWDDLSALKIYHAYSANDGHTYVEVISIPASQTQPANTSSESYFDLKPQVVRIGRGKSGALVSWHYAYESRHLIVPLQGDIVFDLDDGKMLHVHPGEAILAEDWTGRGHRSGCISDTKRTCVGLDILLEPNPHTMPLRDPPKAP